MNREPYGSRRDGNPLAPPLSAGPTDRFYESQGLRLHYADWGNEAAPPLILIHGGRDH